MIHIDGSLTLFRNHTDDFSALRNLQRVGTLFQLQLIETNSLRGFEKLREVGEFNVPSAQLGGLTNFDWLPALTSVRESVTIRLEPPITEEATRALLSRVEVGGETLVR